MREYAKSKLEDNKLEKIVISNADIVSGSSGFRYRNDKEFVYEEKEYEIVRTKSDNGNTIFYCFRDIDDERLFAGLNEHIQRNTDQNLPVKNDTANLIKNIVKDALPDNNKGLNKLNSITVFYPSGKSCLQEPYISKHTPPPKA